MKRWWIAVLLLSSVLVLAQAYNAFRQITLSAPGSDITLPENTVIQYHQLSWVKTGTVSTCTVALDSSPDGTTWTAGGIIAGQTCTTNGNSAVTAGSANYVRITATALSGGGSVQFTYKGWVNNPSGGGGTPGGSTKQFQYNNAGAFAGALGLTYDTTLLMPIAPAIIIPETTVTSAPTSGTVWLTTDATSHKLTCTNSSSTSCIPTPTAIALSPTPTLCTGGQLATGIDINGNATGCTSVASGGPTYSTASTPAAPTVTDVGTPGIITWSYVVVGCQDTACTLHTAASAVGSDTNGNATLTSVNSNKLSAYAVHLDGAQCYNIYRTVAGGTPSTTGKIASCVGQEYSDQGAAGDSGTAPVTNTTVLASNPFPLPGCAIAIGGLITPNAPPCTPNEQDDEFGETGITLDPRWSVVNFTSVTKGVTNGYFFITSTAANNTLRIFHQAVPTAPYAFTAQVCNTPGATAGSSAGMEFDDGTKVTFFSFQQNSAQNRLSIDKWTNATTYSSTPIQAGGFSNCGYMRLTNDNTNVIYSYSADGQNFSPFFTEAKGAFFTTNPTNVGLVLEDASAADQLSSNWFRRTQ